MEKMNFNNNQPVIFSDILFSLWRQARIAELQPPDSRSLDSNNESLQKPRLLLHVCCAPCSSVVLERLNRFFNLTLYFYNPNIFPQQEYTRRLRELEWFVSKSSVQDQNFFPQEKLSVIAEQYDIQEFYRATNVHSEPSLQTEKERGERCKRCYRFRIEKAFEYARTHSFDALTTTLSLSPHKNARTINALGMELESHADSVRFLCADFKKQDGYKRSLELSKKFNLYRQTYCGCEFSLCIFRGKA
jgi:predicted adenine nucleotide alpha hydrolase (AANH) superfamily ATPase